MFFKICILKNLAIFTVKQLCWSLFLMMMMMMMMMMIMMMSSFCGMVDRRKAFSLISSRGHCQRGSRIWTCAEPEFRLSWIKLCTSDNYYTTVPQRSATLLKKDSNTGVLLWILLSILLNIAKFLRTAF